MRQLDLLQYPNFPGHKKPGTSKAAAADMQERAPNIRERALRAIRERGEDGATPDEVAAMLGLSILAVRPRISELLAMAPPPIKESGRTRANASRKQAMVMVRA